jgi:TatD DNase family protein
MTEYSIFDTHCHYNLSPLAENWSEHWTEAQAAGVGKSIIVGTNSSTSQLAISQAKLQPTLRSSVGIHPNEWDPAQRDTALALNLETEMNQLNKLIKNSPDQVVAIGETGLDYFRLNKADSQSVSQLQKTSLIAHFKLAIEHQLPIILHVRDQGEQAYWDTLELVKTEYLPSATQPFILHCVSGPTEYVKTALSLGGYLGMAGNLTYKNAHHLRELVKLAPQDQLLLETDAPYLPPEGYRGQTCQPKMIAQTASYLAENLGFDLEQLYQNAEKVFRF